MLTYAINYKYIIQRTYLLKIEILIFIMNFAISQEKYWEEHPGKAVPLMKPMFYGGPWRVMGGQVPKYE